MDRLQVLPETGVSVPHAGLFLPRRLPLADFASVSYEIVANRGKESAENLRSVSAGFSFEPFGKSLGTLFT